MDDTPDLFNQIAQHYDWWSTVLSADGIHAWHQAAIQWMELQPGQRVLDVGCGTGQVTREIAVAVGPQGQVIGLDPAHAMLAQARRLPLPAQAAPITWVKGQAEALPFNDQEFDCVTAQFSLRNAQDWQAALGELWRVTKPGGRLVILDVVQLLTTWGAVAWRGTMGRGSCAPHAVPMVGRFGATGTDGARLASCVDGPRLEPGPKADLARRPRCLICCHPLSASDHHALTPAHGRMGH
ncbi:MAG: class I SAM-dependent methyltransferase [Firmicutes bacterium]|nr:class I SAM-dependent methyltransferase [Bacillota bacterium]